MMDETEITRTIQHYDRDKDVDVDVTIDVHGPHPEIVNETAAEIAGIVRNALANEYPPGIERALRGDLSEAESEDLLRDLRDELEGDE